MFSLMHTGFFIKDRLVRITYLLIHAKETNFETVRIVIRKRLIREVTRKAKFTVIRGFNVANLLVQ